MLIDNTTRISPVQTPQSFLRSNGLMGLRGLRAYDPEFIDIRNNQISGLGDAAANPTGFQMPDGVTVPAVNSELLYLTNLFRQSQGDAPLNVQANAPTVNVGLSAGTTKLAGFAVAGLLVAFLWSRKKRK